jgi:hypothetical protein
MPTVAVKESTLQRLKTIMREEKEASLDQTINLLIQRAEGMPKSMFGVDKSSDIHLTEEEHGEFQRSHF